MSRPLFSLDLEATGLDIDRHEAWEVGIVAVNDAALGRYPLDDKGRACWEFSVQNLRAAEAGALQVNDYYRRAELAPYGSGAVRYPATWSHHQYTKFARPEAALEIAKLLDGACLLGCAVQFDMRFLEKLLLECGVRPSWHHRGLDLGSYAAGLVGAMEPFASGKLAAQVPNEQTHTALGDAEWNVRVFWHLQKQATQLQGKQ